MEKEVGPPGNSHPSLLCWDSSSSQRPRFKTQNPNQRKSKLKGGKNVKVVGSWEAHLRLTSGLRVHPCTHTICTHTCRLHNTSIEHPGASNYPCMRAMMLTESHLTNDADGFAVVRAQSWPLWPVWGHPFTPVLVTPAFPARCHSGDAHTLSPKGVFFIRVPAKLWQHLLPCDRQVHRGSWERKESWRTQPYVQRMTSINAVSWIQR